MSKTPCEQSLDIMANLLKQPPPSPNEKQVGGDHYQKPIQPWDYITANNLGFLEGNVIKYVSRWKDKNGIEDLKKAQHYLQKLIELNTKTGETP